jgi:putative SOS response-associated peptidase YedK
MHRSRAPSIAPGTFFVAQSWADCITNMAGFNLRQAQVPFNSFSEFNKAEGGDIWFALDESRLLACVAGIWTTWTSVRKVKEGETTNDIYAFLTTEPNAEVGAIHPKAMPVILTTQDEVETWLTASPDEALKLQRPLPDGSLRIVARGVKEDPASAGEHRS